MKHIIITILLLASFLQGNAQSENSYFWSDEIRMRAYVEVLAEVEDGYIVKAINNNRFLGRSEEIELIKYSKDFEEMYAVEVRDLEEFKYTDLETVATSEGILHVYVLTTKSGKQIYSGQLFSYDDLRKMDIVDLSTFNAKTKKAQRLEDLSSLEFLWPHEIRLSQDKSKMLIFNYQEKIGKRKETYYQYSVIDINSSFEILNEGGFYSDQASNKVKIEDLEVSDAGVVNLLLKTFDKNTSREFVNKKPAYDYELHHLTGNDSTDYIYDIKVERDFIDHLKITGDKAGNTFIAGFLREKPFNKIYGAYFLALDEKGNSFSKSRDEYRPRDIKDIIGKEKKELPLEYEMVDVLAGDGVVYVIKQYLDRDENFNNVNAAGNMNRNFGNVNRAVNYQWFLENVLIECHSSATGELLWSTTNRRRQVNEGEYINEFARGKWFVQGSSLYLVYNERTVNMERMKSKEKLKRTDVPGDNTEVVICEIDGQGKAVYESLPQEKRMYASELGVFPSKDQLIFMISNSGKNRHRIGVTSY